MNILTFMNRRNLANKKVQENLDYAFYILNKVEIKELSDEGYHQFSLALHSLIFIFDIVKNRAIDAFLIQALKIAIRLLKDESHTLRTNVVGTLPLPLNKANVAFKIFQLKYLKEDNISFKITEDNIQIEYDYTR